MSETSVDTNIDSTDLAEGTDVEIPNTTAAVVGGTLLGVAGVLVTGWMISKIRARKQGSKETVHLITDAEAPESEEN
jgi:hypothetical protein